MTNEQRRRIKSLCGQIEVVQDENVFMRMACELQELIGQWLCELHHPPSHPQLDYFPTKSKVNGYGPRTGYGPNNGASIYEAIVDDAIALMRSDYASLQMLYPERGRGGALRLVAFRGFDPHAGAFWEWVGADSKTTCAMALRSHRRVVAPDIISCDFMVDSEYQKLCFQAGIHGCQSTPLMDRRGKIVGIISTHWRTPHQPSEGDFRLFDVLARQAADLIQRAVRKQEHC
jgi:GAF domain-containing protein